MSVKDPASQPGLIQALLYDIAQEISDLPVERKALIDAALQKIQSCVDSLIIPDQPGDSSPPIHEMKRLLATSEAKYRELAESITDPFVAYDTGLRLIYRNKAAAQVSQVPDEQALGKTFSELYPNLIGSEIHQLYVQALETHQPQKQQTHWVRETDGEDFYFDLFIYPTSDGVMVLSKDVSARVRAERSQQGALERAAWMARFPDENPNPVARVSVDGKILYCNRSSADPSGWGFQVGEQVPGAFLSFLEEAKRQAKHSEHDLQVGQSIYAIVFMPFPNDRYVNLYGRDITERTQVEIALRESEARLQALVSASAQVLYRMSPDWREMRQLQGGNFLADTDKPNPNWMAEYIHPDDQHWVQGVIDSAVRNGTVFDLEHRVLRADGSIGWTVSRAVPLLNSEGEILEWFGAASDITERKQAEKENIQQKQAFERLAENSPDIIARYDRQHRHIYVNSTIKKVTGRTPADYLGKTNEELGLPLALCEQWRRILEQVFSSGVPSSFEFTFPGINGEAHSYQWMVMPELDEHGQVETALGVARDMTAQKRIELELRRREAELETAYYDLINEQNRLLAVMEALPIGISIQDQHGGVIQKNKGYDAIWGSPLPPANSVDEYEAYQAWWVESGRRVQPEEWASALAIQKGEVITSQFLQIQRFDGKRAFVLNNGAPTRNANGEVTGSVVAIMDITQLIEAENALRESQDRFRVALSAAPLMVYTCDRQLRYTWIYNPLRGFRAEDVLGKRDDELLPAEASAEMIGVKQLALDSGQGGVQEIKVPLKGEDTFYILTTDPIRDKQGNITGLTCSAIDITGQKRIQAEQQEQAFQIEVQRRLMDHREHDRSVIARDLHDGPIQTLSSTLFHLQIIKDNFQDTTLQTELNLIGMHIKNTIRELRVVMSDLRPPALITFGFSKVIQLYIEDLRTRFPDLDIALEAEADSKSLSNDTHLTLFRIFQAGINNIIRHSDASRAWVIFKIEQDSFVLELRDNGVGFEPKTDFSQLTRDGHFGLIGMKERAEAIGAEFSLSSEKGNGTTLVVRGRLSEKNLKTGG